VQLDHVIVNVNDLAASVAFYTSILGLVHDGDDGPFAIVRVSPDFVLLLGERATAGGDHLAFALPPAEFDAVLARLRAARVPYGDAFDSVGSQRGPGRERGARGTGESIYFLDPSRHLLEIMRY